MHEEETKRLHFHKGNIQYSTLIPATCSHQRYTHHDHILHHQRHGDPQTTKASVLLTSNT
jgi:hypothetical protein